MSTVTFERDLAPGVHLRIEDVPAIFRGDGVDRRHYFERKTGERLEMLLSVAEERMRAGETDIRLRFAEPAIPALKIDFSFSGAGARENLAAGRATEKVFSAFSRYPERPLILFSSEIGSLRATVRFRGEADASRRLFDSLRFAIERIRDGRESLAEADEMALRVLRCLSLSASSDRERVAVSFADESAFELDERVRKLILASIMHGKRRQSERVCAFEGFVTGFGLDESLRIDRGLFRGTTLVRCDEALLPFVSEFVGRRVRIECFEVSSKRDLELLDVRLLEK